MAQLLTIPVSDQVPAVPAYQTPTTVPIPPLDNIPRHLEGAVEKAYMDACRRAQAHYDEHLCRHAGTKCPEPSPGQHPDQYRRETLRTFKRTFLPQNHALYKINYRGIDDPVTLRNFEQQLLQECLNNRFNTAFVPEGEIRMVPEMDAFGRTKSYRAVGQTSFVKAMGRPGRLVKNFLVPSDTHGRPVQPLTTRS